MPSRDAAQAIRMSQTIAQMSGHFTAAQVSSKMDDSGITTEEVRRGLVSMRDSGYLVQYADGFGWPSRTG